MFNQKINHLSNFGALGGVQSYLMGLKKYSRNKITLYSTRNPIDIYSSEITGNKIESLNLLNPTFYNKKELFVMHNFILAKIWPFLQGSQKIFKNLLFIMSMELHGMPRIKII